MDEILAWDGDPDSPFYEMIDEGNLGLAGHSFGGETILGLIGPHPEPAYHDPRVGAAVGWHLAQRHRERISHLVAINVPPGSVMSRYLRRSPCQILESWYIFFFQIPWLPEALACLGQWWAPSRALQSSRRPGTFAEEDLEKYRRAWSQPGAFRSMIHW